MNIESVISEKDVELDGYVYLLHAGQYYRGCRRCGGTGHYSFNGFDSICYECGNAAYAKLGTCVGDLEGAQADATKRRKGREARDRAREKKRLALLAQRETAQLKIKESNPAVYEFLMKDETLESRSSFVAQMAHLLQFEIGGKRFMSEKMIAAVEKIIAADAERAVIDAAKAPVVAGRRVVTGKVVSTKSYDSQYGTAYKMLVEEEGGARVFGSIPGALWDEVEFLGAYRKHAWNETDGVMTKLVGMEVTFTATVEASDNDKSFGFFKRPDKASIVA